jgi:hypothetical protein
MKDRFRKLLRPLEIQDDDIWYDRTAALRCQLTTILRTTPWGIRQLIPPFAVSTEQDVMTDRDCENLASTLSQLTTGMEAFQIAQIQMTFGISIGAGKAQKVELNLSELPHHVMAVLRGYVKEHDGK